MKEKSSDECVRLQEIELVMKERASLVKLGKELLAEIDKEKPDTLAINGKLLEVAEHLANIGGFCNSFARRQIDVIKKILAFKQLNPSFYEDLKIALIYIVGIQVDFTKKPFKLISLDLKSFKATIGR